MESEALEAGKLDDVVVQEDMPTEVTLRVVTGATLRVRATNVSKEQIPFGNISLLDGRGKAVVSRVSTFQVLKRLMSELVLFSTGRFQHVPSCTYLLEYISASVRSVAFQPWLPTINTAAPA